MTFELTPEELDSLRTATPAIRALKALILKAERVGIDVESRKQELARREGMVQGMIREFGRTGSRTPSA